MKLLYCTYCQDIFRLVNYYRHCKCDRVSGRYIDSINAIYTGSTAIPLGIAWSSFNKAITNRPVEEGPGERFEAFTIPTKCSTFTRERQ